ncbi:MAG: Uma2 family endonuclease [Dehalococcoidia bacterium]
MGEAGILGEDDRVELIEGEILRMAPIGDRHVGRVIEANDLFTSRLGRRVLVSVQNPVRLSELSEPQPDLVLMRRPDAGHVLRAPHPSDVLLLVEVADTTLSYDRDRKVPLYAKAGIPETWILDIPADVLRVYREPVAGEYRHVEILSRGASIAPLAFPDILFAVDDLLG